MPSQRGEKECLIFRSFDMIREAARVVSAIVVKDHLYFEFYKYCIKTQGKIQMLGMLNDCFMEALVRKKRKKLPIRSWLEARCGSRAEIEEQLCITQEDKNKPMLDTHIYTDLPSLLLLGTTKCEKQNNKE